jgi:hypothetical protein
MPEFSYPGIAQDYEYPGSRKLAVVFIIVKNWNHKNKDNLD